MTSQMVSYWPIATYCAAARTWSLSELSGRSHRFIGRNGWIVLTFGCVIFGLGIGNLTSLPPLIAQREFNREDVVAVVALIVAINHAVFAFAPAIVGAFRDVTSNYGLAFGIVACIQLLAAMVALLGREASTSSRKSGLRSISTDALELSG